jgi:hypothetical protein
MGHSRRFLGQSTMFLVLYCLPIFGQDVRMASNELFGGLRLALLNANPAPWDSSTLANLLKGMKLVHESEYRWVLRDAKGTLLVNPFETTCVLRFWPPTPSPFSEEVLAALISKSVEVRLGMGIRWS